MLLGTSLLRHPCRKTGNGGNVRCQLEVAGEALAGEHRADIREPVVRSSTDAGDPGRAIAPSLCNGRGPSGRAVQ